jgi:ribonuclease HII
MRMARDRQRQVGDVRLQAPRAAQSSTAYEKGDLMAPRYVVGIDESGCGALAGPLIVCAVAFPADADRVTTMWKGIHADKMLAAGDSKGIKNPAHRAALAIAIKATCTSIAVIERSATEIDKRLLGTVFPEAIALAAARCIEKLKSADPGLAPSDILVLIDGEVQRPDLPCPVRLIVDGDKLDWRIGAASVVAKATHDERIDQMHAEYPRWEFDQHRGYPTKKHKELLGRRGPLDVHRKSFRPVQAVMPRPVGIEE